MIEDPRRPVHGPRDPSLRTTNTPQAFEHALQPLTQMRQRASGETADDLAGVSAFRWHRLRAGDDACSEVCLDRLARLGRCGQLDVVETLEVRPLDGDDVAPHLADSPGKRAASQ